MKKCFQVSDMMHYLQTLNTDDDKVTWNLHTNNLFCNESVKWIADMDEVMIHKVVWLAKWILKKSQ